MVLEKYSKRDFVYHYITTAIGNVIWQKQKADTTANIAMTEQQQ